MRKNREKTENDKSLQGAETLGLEPDLNQTYRLYPSDRKTSNLQTAEPPKKTFNFSRDENEFKDHQPEKIELEDDGFSFSGWPEDFDMPMPDDLEIMEQIETAKPPPKTFNYHQDKDELTEDFFDRVIDESDPFDEAGDRTQLQPEFPKIVICYSPAGRPIRVEAKDPEHAEFLQKMNPAPQSEG